MRTSKAMGFLYATIVAFPSIVSWTCSDSPAQSAMPMMERVRTRLNYPGRDKTKKSSGLIVIEYSSTPNASSATQTFADSDADGRWILGFDAWATLDVSIPLSSGGAKIPRGLHALVFEREKSKSYLVFLDAAKLRAKKSTSLPSKGALPGVRVPLSEPRTVASDARFVMKLGVADKTKSGDEITLSFSLSGREWSLVLEAQGQAGVEPGPVVSRPMRRHVLPTPRATEGAAETSIVICHEPAECPTAIEGVLTNLEKDKRFRLGDVLCWSTLETNVPLGIGGTKVPVGYYYLMLERGPGDSWFLILLPAADAWKDALSSLDVASTKGGVRSALEVSRDENRSALPLSIRIEDGADGERKLTIDWGTRTWTAPLQVHE